MKRSELEAHLNDRLDVKSFKDYCHNGLQVEGADEIKRVITGVSVSERLFEAAVEFDAQAVLVHHGLFWRNSPHPLYLKGVLRNRAKALLANDLNLFAFHLPLDSHAELGNNVLIARALDLTDIEPLVLEQSATITAYVGRFPKPLKPAEFAALADDKLNANGQFFAFDKKTIERVFVLSGGGGGDYNEAAEAGADVLVTGSLFEDSFRAGEEYRLALYGAGHYNSEKWGVRALGEELARKFDLDVKFVDLPNPL